MVLGTFGALVDSPEAGLGFASLLDPLDGTGPWIFDSVSTSFGVVVPGRFVSG
jgi:hypothetical protein